MQMPVEVPVEQSISSTSEEEQLKSSDTTASTPAKSSDKAEDLQLLGSFLKIFCFSDLFWNFIRFFRNLLVIANNIHVHIEVLLFSTSFVISVLFGDVKTEKNRLILCHPQI